MPKASTTVDRTYSLGTTTTVARFADAGTDRRSQASLAVEKVAG